MKKSMLVLALAGCAVDDTAIGVQAIVDPTPAAVDQLTAVVEVRGEFGRCSGTVIAADTVITAAHCVCSDNWVGGNICLPDVDVAFREPTGGQRHRAGRAVAHPDYNPAWTERQVEHDVAVIRMRSASPPYVVPASVASSPLPTDSIVMVAGFGHTGEDCDGPGGTLNFDFDRIDDYEDGHDIAVFFDQNTCKGDSGGPVFDPSAATVHAVHSLATWTVLHGWVSKAVTTSAHFGWIREQTCRSPRLYPCSGTDDRCICTGTGDVLVMDPSGRTGVLVMDGATIVDRFELAPGPRERRLAGIGDFDGDARQELVWRDGDRLVRVALDGRETTLADKLDAAVAGTGDLDGDGLADIVVSRGAKLAVWPAGDPARELALEDPHTAEPAWRLLAIADFDGDERADLVWQHDTGTIAIGDREAGLLDPRWTLLGTGDFDGDLQADLVFRDDTGTLSVWFAGTQRDPKDPDLFPLATSAQLVGVADFDHDGRDDLLWQGDDTATLWFVDGLRITGTAKLALDGATPLAALRDTTER